MINHTQFTLMMEVIAAAKEGRYMYGNGAQWFIMDTYGKAVYINHIEGTRAFAPNYVGCTVDALAQAESLEKWLMSEVAEDPATTYMPYYTAKAQVAKHYMAGEVVFTNGNQWYIKPVYSNYITVIELGTMVDGRDARVYSMSAHASWKYIRANGATPVEVNASTKQYFGLAA
jgi:hypothetical protein